MSSTVIALIAVACIFGGTLVGLILRKFLPADHLSADSKDAVKVGASMISMMSALVLGLLVSSAKSTYDSANQAIVESAAKTILLDRVLASYGPEAKELRQYLRDAVAAGIQALWPDENVEESLRTFEKAKRLDVLIQKVRELNPQTDMQRSLQDQAQKLCEELMLTRWLQIEQAQVKLPLAFLVVLLFWLTALYLSFGLLAPKNMTVVVVMFVGALALATALFLILEMSRPMSGAIRASNAPMLKALEHLGN